MHGAGGCAGMGAAGQLLAGNYAGMGAAGQMQEGCVRGVLGYSSDVFDAQMMELLVQHFEVSYVGGVESGC